MVSSSDNGSKKEEEEKGLSFQVDKVFNLLIRREREELQMNP